MNLLPSRPRCRRGSSFQNPAIHVARVEAHQLGKRYAGAGAMQVSSRHTLLQHVGGCLGHGRSAWRQDDVPWLSCVTTLSCRVLPNLPWCWDLTSLRKSGTSANSCETRVHCLPMICAETDARTSIDTVFDTSLVCSATTAVLAGSCCQCAPLGLDQRRGVRNLISFAHTHGVFYFMLSLHPPPRTDLLVNSSHMLDASPPSTSPMLLTRHSS